jgi:hypothetical protein
LTIIRSGKMPDGSAWDPFEQVLVDRTTGTPFVNEEAPPGRVEFVRQGPNRVEIKTESSVPSLLVLAANHYPGWQAHVDGRRVKTLRVNYNQRGVALRPGKHTVMFNYQPRSAQSGIMISLVTLVALLGWANLEPARPRAGEHVTP